MKKTLLLLAGLAFFACNPNETPEKDKTPDFSDTPIKIIPVITRATEGNFENGDAIGLTVTRASGIHANNARLSFDGTVFKSTLTWYAEADDEAALAAYFPYSETAPATFTVAADQSKGLASSDFLAAVKEHALPAQDGITMSFKPLFSRLVLNVSSELDAEIESITVKGLIPTAVISKDLTAAVDPAAEAADIKAFHDGNAWTIVVPAQKAAVTVAASAGGKVVEQELDELTLTPGGQLAFSVTIKEQVPEVPFEEHLSEYYFLYDGERYSVIPIFSSRWIMTQSLRYVPEGKTVSDNPADGNGIWYPYSSDGTNITVDKSPEAAEARGYLYDHQTAFAAEITAENFKNFEGVQGICPPGWHIPTLDEFVSIVGYSNSPDGGSAITMEDAFFYDRDYKAARIKTLNNEGFNFDFAGTIMRNNSEATGKYQATITKTTTCSVSEWIGKNAVTYYMGSTGHTPANTATNRQFMSLMSTFTGSYPEGRLSVGYSNYLAGNSLRCISNRTAIDK